MNIAVDGSGFFDLGWLTRFLGLPRSHPHATALRKEDMDVFLEGWDTANETPEDGYPNRLTAFYAMLQQQPGMVIWVDDDNNEIDQKGKLV